MIKFSVCTLSVYITMIRVIYWARFFPLFNPFTLRASRESIVCYSHSFENILQIKGKFTKYLKES